MKEKISLQDRSHYIWFMKYSLFTWYSGSYICCWFCNSFDEFVRFDFNCKSSLPVCLSGYSEHQIHLHITQFWQIVWFAPKFTTLVIEMDANSQNERENQNCSILEREADCCWQKDYLRKPKSFRLLTQVRDSAPTLLSVSDLCGNFVAATEVKPPQQLAPNLSAFGGLSHIHKEAAFGECNISTSCWLKDQRLLPPVCPS